MSITAVSCTYLLSIVGLFPTPVQLQKFAADDIFSTESVAPAEAMMGVDGFKTAGLIYVMIPQSISLMGDSPSNDVFDAWIAAQKAAQDTFDANGIVIFPALRKKWTMTNGTLTLYPPTPSAGKVIQPRKYTITWESMEPSPI